MEGRRRGTDMRPWWVGRSGTGCAAAMTIATRGTRFDHERDDRSCVVRDAGCRRANPSARRSAPTSRGHAMRARRSNVPTPTSMVHRW